jgi:tetratricopeptide (TPR) repeat protein
MKYRAFISYSHSDGKVATRLHRWLEAYRVPRRLAGRETQFGPVPTRLHPIFRDREELPTSADLGSQIQAALAASATLIVVCSRRAATSRWVNEEILAFKRLGRSDRILCLIVDGEPNATDKPGRAEEECFPPALRFHLAPDGTLSSIPAEPIAADLRTVGDGRRDAFLKVAAGLAGVGFDELRQRELQRQVRRAFTFSAVSLALLAAMAGLAVAALLARREAVQQRAIALRERDRAEENFREARDAVDRFYTKVAEEDLLRAEGLQPLRQDLLEQALEYYRRFLEQRGNDPDFSSDAAVVQGNVASILADVGDPADALVAAEQATKVFEAIRAANPTDPRITGRLAGALAVQAVVLDRLDRTQDALDRHVRSLELHESLPVASPDRSAAESRRLWSARGAFEARLGQLEAAVRSYERSLALAEAAEPEAMAPLGVSLEAAENGVVVVGVTPDSPAATAGIRVGDILVSLADVPLPALDAWPEARRRLEPNDAVHVTVIRAGERVNLEIVPVRLGDITTAATKYNLGYLLLERMDQPDRARPWLEQAVDEYRRALLRQSAATPDIRQGLAFAAGVLGTCGLRLGDMELFERGTREAARVAEENVQANPAVPAYRTLAGINLTNLSTMLWQQERLDEAAKACEAAIGQFRTAIETGGNLASDRLQLLQSLTNLGLIREAQGGSKAAVPIYEAALEASRGLDVTDDPRIDAAVGKVRRLHAESRRKATKPPSSAMPDKGNSSD